MNYIVNKGLFNALNSDLNKIVIFIVVLLFSFTSIFWGCDFTDTFYWINHYSGYRSDSLRVGTNFIGFLWANLFGNSLLSVRIFAWLIGITTVIGVYCALVERGCRIKRLYYLMPTILLLRFTAFSADKVTLFTVSISLVFFIKYLHANNPLYMILLGVSSAVAIFVRFPNILLTFVVSCYLIVLDIVSHASKDKVHRVGFKKILLIYLLVNIISVIVFSIILYGNPKNFIMGLNISLARQTLDGTHTIPAMMKSILRDANKIYLYLGILFLIDFITKMYNNTFIKHYKIAIVFVLYFIASLFVKVELLGSSYNWNLKLFYSASVLFIILKGIHKDWEKKEGQYKKVLVSLLIISFSGVAALGSDTGLLKFRNILICFLPFILIEFNVSQVIGRNKYLIPLVMIFIGVGTLMSAKPYEDQWLNKLTTTIKSEKQLKYIRTSPERAGYINDVMNEYSKYSDTTEVMFFGKVSHIFNYLTNKKPLYDHSFWMLPNDNVEVSKAEYAIIRDLPVIFYVPKYPSSEGKEVGGEYTRFEKMVIDKGYKEKPFNQFKIYSLTY